MNNMLNVMELNECASCFGLHRWTEQVKQSTKFQSCSCYSSPV